MTSSLSAETGCRCSLVHGSTSGSAIAGAACSTELSSLVGMAATSGDAAAACPAYPWPSDGAQRGRKVFMQSDCAACHSMLPYAGHSDDAARAEAVQPKAVEIVVVEEAQPAATVNGGSCSPDLTLITEGLRGNLYAGTGATVAPRMLADATAVCQDLKKRAMASPVWL